VCPSAANIRTVSFVFADLKEALVTELREVDLFFAVTSYVAENEDAINLVEGERVYVLGEYLVLNVTGVHSVECLVGGCGLGSPGS